MQVISENQWAVLKSKLARSRQIDRLEMGEPEIEYVQTRGMEILRLHAIDFVRKRIGPANPKNDGRQTPRKGHPVFIAQHATGTSDRSKLQKFHGIPCGADLTDPEIHYVADVILRWIEEQTTHTPC